MRVYDITVGLSPDTPVWPGDPKIEIVRARSISDGANSNVSTLHCSVHAGTHVDAPIHFFDGSSTVDRLPLKILTGRAYVVSLPKARVLDAATLESAGLPPRTRRVLFKTRNSALWSRGETAFQQDFVGIDAGGAEWLVRRGVQLVGVDYLSIAPFGKSRDTHRILLAAGVICVEGLDLSDVSQGRYTLTCLPLKLIGSDGAPARAILIGV
jgi:arylformamidase